MSDLPKRLPQLTEALTVNRWSYVVNHSTDTGGHPYIGIEARRGTDTVMVTWHTRAAGTYRLFTCMHNKRDKPLVAVMAEITA